MRKRKINLSYLFIFWCLKKMLADHVDTKSEPMGRAQRSQVDSPTDPVTGNSIYPEHFPWV